MIFKVGDIVLSRPRRHPQYAILFGSGVSHAGVIVDHQGSVAHLRCSGVHRESFIQFCKRMDYVRVVRPSLHEALDRAALLHYTSREVVFSLTNGTNCTSYVRRGLTMAGLSVSQRVIWPHTLESGFDASLVCEVGSQIDVRIPIAFGVYGAIGLLILCMTSKLVQPKFSYFRIFKTTHSHGQLH